LTPACSRLLEYRMPGLGPLISTFHAISAQFTLEMCVAAQNREKFTETPYFGGSRSFKVIDVTFLRSSSPVLVMLTSMSVPICNHFHAERSNSGRITLFKGVPLFHPSVRGDPFTQKHEILSWNTKDPKLSYGKNPKSLSHLVLERYRDVPDRQTDRQNYRS